MIGCLAWRPFDALYEDMITRLTDHDLLLRAVMHDSTQEEIFRLRSKYENVMKRIERSPRDYHQDEIEKNRLLGTEHLCKIWILMI
jgi:hypothetical protein